MTPSPCQKQVIVPDAACAIKQMKAVRLGSTPKDRTSGFIANPTARSVLHWYYSILNMFKYVPSFYFTCLFLAVFEYEHDLFVVEPHRKK